MDRREDSMDGICSSQMKVYAQNSFDRFGDDLTQLILSFLWIEDKIRLECVSKQWKRYVFNKQFVIEIVDKTRKYCEKEKNNSLDKLCLRSDDKRQLVESVLKKCPNIKKVIISGEVLSLFGQYCPNIKSLTLLIDRIISLDFFVKYGHKLEELMIYKIKDRKTVNIREVLKLCPNLKKVNVPKGLNYLIEHKDFLPKLEFFGTNFINVNCLLPIGCRDVNQLKILSDKYRQTMKILELSFDDMSYEELKTCFDYICRFENLKELKLYMDRITQPIDDCLSLIGQKCNKVLKLNLKIDACLWVSDTFSKFKAIKTLRIEIPDNRRELSGSVECFKHCKQLIELDINYSELREDFFTNIATFVPKLQFLKISTEKQFSDSFIDSFYSMKNFQRVKLRVNNESIEIKFWCFGKKLFEVMSSAKGKDVKRVNDNCGLIACCDNTEYETFEAFLNQF